MIKLQARFHSYKLPVRSLLAFYYYFTVYGKHIGFFKFMSFEFYGVLFRAHFYVISIISATNKSFNL